MIDQHLTNVRTAIDDWADAVSRAMLQAVVEDTGNAESNGLAAGQATGAMLAAVSFRAADVLADIIESLDADSPGPGASLALGRQTVAQILLEVSSVLEGGMR